MYNENNSQSFIVMRNCVTELYSMDTVASYQHAFVYIRQLAIHVRNAMTSMTETEYAHLIVLSVASTPCTTGSSSTASACGPTWFASPR